MTGRRKLIEMDDKKSHGAKEEEEEGWNIKLKAGRGKKSWSIFVSMTTPAYPRLIVRGSANSGSKSCIFGIPPGQVVIGSAHPGWGRDRLDMRIWFAY